MLRKKNFFATISCVILLAGGFNLITTNIQANADIQRVNNNNALVEVELRGIAKDKNFYEIEIDSYYEKDESLSKNVKTLSKTISENEEFIFHNNGKPINTDIFVEKNGFELVALHKATIDGTNYVGYYYDNRIDYSDGIESIISQIKTQPLMIKQSKAKNEQVGKHESRSIHNDYWKFKYKGKNILSFSNTVEFTRKSNNTSINGVKGSVWDVLSLSQLEDIDKYENINLSEQRTILSMQPFDSQSLIDWSSENYTNGKTVLPSVNEDEAPDFDFSSHIGKWKIEDLSSKSNKYGSWRYSAGIISKVQKDFKTSTRIRGTNTNGNFGLEVSHTFKHKRGNYQTGVVQKFVEDR